MVTYAPEEDKDGSFSKFLASKGIVLSAGHTASTDEDLEEKGVTQVTHLFNAMPGLHHRNNSVTIQKLLVI